MGRLSNPPSKPGRPHEWPYDEETLWWIEQRNFENLIWFYRAELRRVQRGKRVNLSFSAGRKLKKAGILVPRKHRLYLTPRAERVLAEIVGQERDVDVSSPQRSR